MKYRFGKEFYGAILDLANTLYKTKNFCSPKMINVSYEKFAICFIECNKLNMDRVVFKKMFLKEFNSFKLEAIYGYITETASMAKIDKIIKKMEVV